MESLPTIGSGSHYDNGFRASLGPRAKWLFFNGLAKSEVALGHFGVLLAVLDE
jgi:hypothetical protein